MKKTAKSFNGKIIYFALVALLSTILTTGLVIGHWSFQWKLSNFKWKQDLRSRGESPIGL